MNAAPSALHEVRVLLRLGEDSPHTVQLRDYFEENISGTLHFYLELEHCAGGDLEMLIKSRQRRVTEPGSAAANVERRPFSEAELVDILSQVYAGVRWVHARRVIHCDIKPANVLLTANGRVKICDFGIGKLLKHTGASTHHMAGSRAFMAPEVLRYYVGEQVRFTSSADIWSLGVVVVAMATLQATPRMARLTEEKQQQQQQQQQGKGKGGGEALEHLLGVVAHEVGANWACDFVRRALCLRPEARATAVQLETLLPQQLQPAGIEAPPVATDPASHEQQLAVESAAADAELRQRCPQSSALFLAGSDSDDDEAAGGGGRAGGRQDSSYAYEGGRSESGGWSERGSSLSGDDAARRTRDASLATSGGWSDAEPRLGQAGTGSPGAALHTQSESAAHSASRHAGSSAFSSGNWSDMDRSYPSLPS